ncbi:MAG: MerR family transcriptional regulator [Granulosicoccaceae bacterium]
MKETYTIGELAREFGITTRTIRFYEEKRFLEPQRVGRNRVYSRRDRTHLRLLLRGRRLGWALDDIWEIINLYNSQGGEEAQLAAMLERLKDTRGMLDTQLEDIRSAKEELEEIEANCRSRYAAALARKNG